MKTLLDWLISSELPIYLNIINIFLYVWCFRKYSKSYKYFTLFLLTVGIVQVISIVIVKLQLGSNLFMSHFFYILQFVFLSLFYKELLKEKWIKWVMFIVLGILAIQYVLKPNIFYEYNAIGMAITQFFVVLYAILYFYKCLEKQGEFLIINTGIFLYLLSSAIIFSSGNFFLSLPIDLMKTFWAINGLLYIIFQLFILIEWFKNYRRRPTSINI